MDSSMNAGFKLPQEPHIITLIGEKSYFTSENEGLLSILPDAFFALAVKGETKTHWSNKSNERPEPEITTKERRSFVEF